jgi:hypothetical protein
MDAAWRTAARLGPAKGTSSPRRQTGSPVRSAACRAWSTSSAEVVFAFSTSPDANSLWIRLARGTAACSSCAARNPRTPIQATPATSRIARPPRDQPTIRRVRWDLLRLLRRFDDPLRDRDDREDPEREPEDRELDDLDEPDREDREPDRELELDERLPDVEDSDDSDDSVDSDDRELLLLDRDRGRSPGSQCRIQSSLSSLTRAIQPEPT